MTIAEIMTFFWKKTQLKSDENGMKILKISLENFESFLVIV